jgi:hypothetical protein
MIGGLSRSENLLNSSDTGPRPETEGEFAIGKSLHNPLTDALCIPTRGNGFPSRILEAGAVDVIMVGRTSLFIPGDYHRFLSGLLVHLLTTDDRRRRYDPASQQRISGKFAQETARKEMKSSIVSTVEKRR